MMSFGDAMHEYKRQLDKGVIQQAYRGLMDYVMGLRTHLKTRYPDYTVPGSIYYGYMDMTYFAFSPESFRQRNLKVAIVFLHEPFRFEAWLAGVNKQVQAEYWKLFRESNWNQYRLVPTIQGADSILECVLADDPDFGDPDALTRLIEDGTLKFVADVQDFLSHH